MLDCLIKKTGLRKMQVLFLLSLTLLAITVTVMTTCSKFKTHFIERGKYQILKELIEKERHEKPDPSAIPMIFYKKRGLNDD
jgi:hypothetical protein